MIQVNSAWPFLRGKQNEYDYQRKLGVKRHMAWH